MALGICVAGCSSFEHQINGSSSDMSLPTAPAERTTQRYISPNRVALVHGLGNALLVNPSQQQIRLPKMQPQPGQADVYELRERVKVLEEQLSRLLAAQGSTSSSIVRSPAPSADVPDTLPDTVPMGATRIVMHQIVAPAEVDALGICFGGQVCRQCSTAPPAP